MFKNILVPIDLNPKAYKASMYALDIAHMYDSKLFLLNVSENLRSKESLVMSRVSVADLEKSFKNYALDTKNAMRDILNDDLYDNVDIEYYIREGNTTDEILDFTERYSIDLIVMGTNGKDSMADYILGTEFRIGAVFMLLVFILVYRRFKLSKKREYLK